MTFKFLPFRELWIYWPSNPVLLWVAGQVLKTSWVSPDALPLQLRTAREEKKQRTIEVRTRTLMEMPWCFKVVNTFVMSTLVTRTCQRTRRCYGGGQRIYSRKTWYTNSVRFHYTWRCFTVAWLLFSPFFLGVPAINEEGCVYPKMIYSYMYVFSIHTHLYIYN